MPDQLFANRKNRRRSAAQKHGKSAKRRPLIELLEPRNLLAVTVNTFDDAVVDDEFTSLREAIGLAAGVPGEVIELPAGTYQLALGELSITDAAPVTIQSTGGQATIDALAASRVFSIESGSDVTLRGLVITNGSVSDLGGGVANWGTVTIDDCAFVGNFAAHIGGGLRNIGAATIKDTRFEGNASTYGAGIQNEGVSTITGGAFLNNTVIGNGGGIENLGTLSVTGTSFEGNAAHSPNPDTSVGGAIHTYGGLSDLPGTTELTDCIFLNNSSTWVGGGVVIDEAVATITDCTFEGNSAIYGGGYAGNGTSTITGGAFRGNTASGNGGGVEAIGTVSLIGTVLENNTASSYGGGVHTYGGFSGFPGALTLDGATVRNNTAYYGGGISFEEGPASIIGTTISDNTATYGGGIYTRSGWGSITDTTVENNFAYSLGGGFYNDYFGNVSVTGSSFTGNTATSSGGGIAVGYQAALELSDSTVASNTAYSGGGLYLENSYGSTAIADSEVSGNSAEYGGGIYLNAYASTTNITGSTISANTATYGGGGLYDAGSSLNLAESEVSNNAADFAGGIFVGSYDSTSITDSTISANQGAGVVIQAAYVQLTGNTILDNGGDGIQIEYGYYNVIGTPENGNTITGNTGAGVAVLEGSTGNAIRGNVIQGNGGLAIDLEGDGPTPNDPGDTDYGPNDLQNYPVITSVSTGATTDVTGQLDSVPYTTLTIDLYALSASVPYRYLGSFEVSTDGSGLATFDVTLDVATNADDILLATATDWNGSTSEFAEFTLIEVAPVSGLITTENGAQATFEVVLTVPPISDVTVPLVSSNPSEGVVSPAALIFTPTNWNVPQVATVTGVDDATADGTVAYTILTGPASSSDLRFDAEELEDVQVTNFDNDFPTADAIRPDGSWVYRTELESVISAPGNLETFSLLLDPGQTLSVLVEASDDLQAVVQVYRSNGALVGTATAPAAGADALVQTIRIPGQIAGQGGAPTLYTIQVRGAGGTTGNFRVSAHLNTALEVESHDGPTNDTLATADSLKNSLITFNTAGASGKSPQPSRGAVLGELALNTLTTVFSADFESGEQGFNVDNEPASSPNPGIPGLWHLSTGRGAQTGHSANTSFYFGEDEGSEGGGDYSRGTSQPAFGAIISPSIALPATTNALVIDFNYVLQTRRTMEPDRTPDVDNASLQIDSGAGWTTLQRYDRDAESLEWRTSDAVDVTAYGGQTVRFRWTFDTIRGPVGRAPEGWYVDDVRIREVILADHYSIELAKGESLTAALTGLSAGNSDLALLGPDGDLLAIGSADAATNVSESISDFVATTTGTYYLKITGDSDATYSLLVTRNAEFDSESNNSIDEAQAFLAPTVAGSQWALGFVGGSGGELSQVRNPSYVRSAVGSPWGSSSNDEAMDRVFGTGQWQDLRFETVDAAELFSNTTDFVFLEGSDSNANELESFLIANQLLIEQYVAAGNTLLVNAAPNEGNGMSFGFGGVELVYDDFSNSVYAADPQAAIFVGPFAPVTTDYTGSSFGHATVTGSGLEPLILASSGRFVLAEKQWGQGRVLFGGMTTSNFHYPYPEADNLRANIIAYVAASGRGDLGDFYEITADGNNMIEIETRVPAYLSGEFINELDPMVRLYDSEGNQVASNDNGAPDGRNAKLSYKVPKNGGGVYFVEVSASDLTAEPTKGDYILSVKGANTSQQPFEVTNTDPMDGERFYSPPSQITVNVNDNILLPTLEASDLQVDGMPASGVTLSDGDTAVFDVRFAYEYNGHYYALTTEATDWISAEAEANALGAHLVTVNSQEENDFLERVLFSGSKSREAYWIGFTDEAEEGQFVWSSGEPVTYTNWNAGEPNDFGDGEDYASINWHYSVNFDITRGTWNDSPVGGAINGPHFGIIELSELPAGFNAATEGIHDVTIAGGAIKDVQGTSIAAYNGTFVVDYTAPQIVGSSIQQNDTVTADLEDFRITIGFSEAMDTSNVDLYDVSLAGQLSGNLYEPTELVFNGDGTELTISFSGIALSEDQYQLTLFSGDLGFQDLIGLDLDGETPDWPIPANVSGDGLEGGDFVVDFTVDAANRSVPVPLVPINPLGSLVYTTAVAASGVIGPGGDTDDWTIELDPGQTVSLVLDSSDSLVGTVALIAPDGSTLGTATAAGADATVLLQTVSVGPGGTYTIRVGGASGTNGGYSFEVTVNSALEEERYGGPSNDDILSAQSIDTSFINLPGGGDRGAVLGVADGAGGYEATSLPFDFTDISGTGTAALQGSDDGQVYLGPLDLNGFEFTTSGMTASELYVSANGSVYFPFVDGYGYVYAMARDLYVFEPDGAVYWQVIGSGDQQQLVVQWNDVGFYYYPGADPITFQMILSEADGSIQFNYLDLQTDLTFANEGRNANVGFESYNYTTGVYSSLFLPTFDAPNQYVGTGRSTRIAVEPATGDSYAFQLHSGQSATISATSLSGGDVDISLFDGDGNLIATGIEVGTNVSEIITPTELTELADAVASVSRTYFIQVTSDSTVDYSLVVTRGATFEVENNNTPANAQRLDDSGIVLGYVSSLEPLLGADNGDRNLLSVDPVTGAATILATNVGGGNGYNDLARNPVTGLLYGSQSLNGWGLYAIDPDTLAETFIGDLGGSVRAMAWSSDGLTLYGFRDSTLGSIDPTTAAFTPIGDSGLYYVGGMAFQPGTDTLFAVTNRDNGLYTIDLSNGAATYVGDPGDRYNSLEFLTDGTLRAGVARPSVLFGGGSLVRLDPDTAAATFIGVTVPTGYQNLTALESLPATGDFYQVDAQAGDLLQFVTSTPGDRSGEFVNSLQPLVRVYDPSGNLLVTEDNIAPDGRNVIGSYLVPENGEGTYYIEVVAVGDTFGEYTLSVTTGVPASLNASLASSSLASLSVPPSDSLNDSESATASLSSTVLDDSTAVIQSKAKLSSSTAMWPSAKAIRLADVAAIDAILAQYGSNRDDEEFDFSNLGLEII